MAIGKSKIALVWFLLFIIHQAASYVEDPDWDEYAMDFEKEPGYKHMDWKYYHGHGNYSSSCRKDSTEVHRGCFKVDVFKYRFYAAVEVIEQYLMPFVEREKFNISSKCILHPDNNLFWRHEWFTECGSCKQELRGMELSNLRIVYENDYPKYGRSAACDVFQCYLVMNCLMKYKKTEFNPEEAVKNRQFCESLANSCFPANEGPSDHQLHELFLRQVCAAHTFSGRPDWPIIEMMKKQNMYLAILVSILLVLIFRPGGYLHIRMKYEKTELHPDEAVKNRQLRESFADRWFPAKCPSASHLRGTHSFQISQFSLSLLFLFIVYFMLVTCYLLVFNEIIRLVAATMHIPTQLGQSPSLYG